jgi:hypothetical protein
MNFGFGMRCVDVLKKPCLTDLSFVFEFGIKIGKDMFTIIARHGVEGFVAPLRQDDGIGRQYCREIVSSGFSSGTESIFISFKAGVIG